MTTVKSVPLHICFGFIYMITTVYVQLMLIFKVNIYYCFYFTSFKALFNRVYRFKMTQVGNKRLISNKFNCHCAFLKGGVRSVKYVR